MFGNPQTELVTIQCGSCGVWHSLPKAMYDKCVEEGGYWHCPNGHSRGYKEGKHEREAVRRERDQLKQRLAQRDEELAKLRRATERQKKRIANGVCLDCNRTFSNLARHMKTKHAEHKH